MRPHESLREFLPYLLRQVTQSMEQAVAASLAEHGADWTTVRLLVPLQRFGELSQAALADRAGLDRSTASALLAELEYDGLVVRQPDASDGRRLLVRGTDALGDVVVQLREAVHSAEDDALPGLDRRERERLRVLLDRSLPPESGGLPWLRPA